MTKTNYPQDLSLPMLITQNARQQAYNFASQQPNIQKRKQVYYNTLAILVVNEYLQWLNIDTDLLASDSWQPVTRYTANTSDLHITNIGRLECLPLLENEQFCSVSPEVCHNRIGYVLVEIKRSLKEAIIWGFSSHLENEELAINQLQPLEELISYLHHLKEKSVNTVNLSEWLTGILTKEWQNLENLFGNQAIPTYTFRSDNVDNSNNTLRQGKLIDLGIILNQQPLVLLVAITPEKEDKLIVCIQLQTTSSQHYLPPKLQMNLIDSEDKILKSVKSRMQDNLIQLPKFKGEIGEEFTIQIKFEESIITEKFRI